MQFEMIEKDDVDTVIKVIGVGGAGGNAVDHMIRENVQGVTFIVANTDSQALNNNHAPIKLTLGKLGAGGKPEAGKAAAEANRGEIREKLSGAHMVFITAGMGGGTGTGAAPVVAEVTKEMGILTVGVVSKPFVLEGSRRMKNAETGIAELARYVDSLIIIQNEKLHEVMDDDATQDESFRMADDVLKNAVGGIAEIITCHGLVNVDFEDVRTVMGEPGRAMMGSCVASGADRARIAAEQALASPLLEGVNLSNARGVLVNVTASRSSLKMKEVKEVMATVNPCATEDAHIIYGTVYDDSMGDSLRVTVVVTGLGQLTQQQPNLTVIPNESFEHQATGTHDYHGGIRSDDLDLPPGMRKGGLIRSGRKASIEALEKNGVTSYDIPAFLRKQAD